MDIGLSFDDVLIRPQLGVVDHRSEINLSTRLGDTVLQVPILSAPMSSVTDGGMASAMFRAGGMGVIHRAMSIEDQVAEYRLAGWAMCAVGLDDYERVDALLMAGCRHLMIDVAHAHTVRMLQFVESLSLRGVAVYVGSVATKSAVNDFIDAGASGFRVGIGPGAACITREVTGAGVPQLTAIMECYESARDYNLPIIADGGIRTSGDIVKAIVAGANAVMLGWLLAGSDEAVGNGTYYGMASERAMEEFGKEGIVAEGKEGKVSPSGPVAKTINKLAGGIRSGVSYAGGLSLDDIRGMHEIFIRTTGNTLSESAARI